MSLQERLTSAVVSVDTEDISSEGPQEHQDYFDQAQTALEWLANMRDEFDGNNAVESIVEETEEYARALLDPNMPLEGKADEADHMERGIADLEYILHRVSEPDTVYESDWHIDENGSESKIHIGGDEHGFHYAREASPVMDEEENLHWHGPYPTQEEAEGAAYEGGNSGGPERLADSEEQEQEEHSR